MKPAARGVLALLTLLIAAQPGVCQGLYIEALTKGGPVGSEGTTTRSYLMPRMFKAEGVSEDGQMIVRADRRMIYEVSPQDRTYSEATFDEWDAAMKRIAAKLDPKTNPKMAELQKKIAAMPPEQRKKMEQMMGGTLGGGGKGTVDVVKTGETKPILGHATMKYVIKSDGKDMMTLWVAKDIKGFDAIRGDYEEMFSRTMAGLSGRGGKLLEAMKKIDGFPLETTMGAGVTMLVTKVEQRAIPESEFTVPAGYTKVPSKISRAGKEED